MTFQTISPINGRYSVPTPGNLREGAGTFGLGGQVIEYVLAAQREKYAGAVFVPLGGGLPAEVGARGWALPFVGRDDTVVGHVVTWTTQEIEDETRANHSTTTDPVTFEAARSASIEERKVT